MSLEYIRGLLGALDTYFLVSSPVTILFLIIVHRYVAVPKFQLLFGVFRYLIAGTATAYLILYAIELLNSYFNGLEYAGYDLDRLSGPYAWAYLCMIICGVFLPLILWVGRWGSKPWIIFSIAVLSHLGLFYERFVIFLTSFLGDYAPEVPSVSRLWLNLMYEVLYGLFVGIAMVITLISYDKLFFRKDADRPA